MLYYFFSAYITALATAQKVGIIGLKSIPCSEMPITLMPGATAEYQDGVVSVRVPSMFTLVSSGHNGTNAFPLQFSDCQRLLRVSEPGVESHFETICLHINRRMAGMVHISQTSLLEMSFPNNTSENLDKKTFPMFIKECYKCDFQNIHWKMSEKELSRQLVLLTASTLFRGNGDGTAEFYSSAEYDGILHYGGNHGVFTWEGKHNNLSGYIYFVSHSAGDNLVWARSVCQSISFL
jgi:hypothetical protein